jgi:hypothetical protein
MTENFPHHFPHQNDNNILLQKNISCRSIKVKKYSVPLVVYFSMIMCVFTSSFLIHNLFTIYT